MTPQTPAVDRNLEMFWLRAVTLAYPSRGILTLRLHLSLVIILNCYGEGTFHQKEGVQVGKKGMWSSAFYTSFLNMG